MPYQVGRVLAITKRVAELGSRVDFEPGWEHRGSSSFTPRCHVLHHDAAAKDVLWLIRDGHASLSGPLANFYIPRDGTLWAVAAGRANHAGRGGWAGFTGNDKAWGTEVANNGAGERYTAAQLRTIDRLHVALHTIDGIPLDLMCSHAEWAPSRKSDIGDGPGRPWNMGFYRTGVAQLINEEDIVTPQDKADIAGQAAMLVIAALDKHQISTRLESIWKDTDKIAEVRRNLRRIGERVGAAGIEGAAPPTQTPLSASLSGQVDTEDLANALLNVLRPEIVELARQTGTLDQEAMVSAFSDAVERVFAEQAAVTAEALQNRLAG